MSTYKNDNPDFLKEALNSIVSSSVLPSELVLVLDGQIPLKNKEIINSFIEKIDMKIIHLPENLGLGLALQKGLAHCSYEWIARFDTDDICLPDRFAKQIAFIEENPHIDVFSSPVLEFSDVKNNFFIKKVPVEENLIKKYAKKRNPINHMSAMFKKSSVLEVGGYRDDLFFEDYSLWVRLLVGGYKIGNMDIPTVYARTGVDMVKRRGGLKYFVREVRIQYNFFKWGFLSLFEFLANISLRFPIRLAPTIFRGKIYEKFLR